MARHPRPARTRTGGARKPGLGAPADQPSRTVSARPRRLGARRRRHLPAVAGQSRPDRRPADEDLRARAAGTARRGNRGGGGRAQLPRRNGDPGVAAVELLRTLGARPHGGHGGERDRAPRRRRRAHLPHRRRRGVHAGRLHRQPRRGQGLPGVPQTRCAEHGAGRLGAVGVRHRLRRSTSTA